MTLIADHQEWQHGYISTTDGLGLAFLIEANPSFDTMPKANVIALLPAREHRASQMRSTWLLAAERAPISGVLLSEDVLACFGRVTTSSSASGRISCVARKITHVQFSRSFHHGECRAGESCGAGSQVKAE